MKKLGVIISIAAAIALTVGETAVAQQGQLPHEKRGLGDTGRERWIVYLNSNDFNFRAKPIADFASHDDAARTSSELNDALPMVSPYFYQVIERSTNSTSPPPESLPRSGQKPADPPSSGPNGPLPKALLEKPRPLGGSLFSGSEDLGGYGKLSFGFHANGLATMRDTDGTVHGSWQQSGQEVTLRFYNGNVVYRGRWSGNSMSGTASNGKTTWSWSLHR